MKREHFTYELPETKIAKTPVKPRHNSKLLHYKEGLIEDYSFLNIHELLSEGTQLVMNNAKVIPARIFCKKETGAQIEVFLLEPIGDYLSSFSNTQSVSWKALVGNKKRWKEGAIYSLNNELKISWIDRENNILNLEWGNSKPFAEILELIGKIPIPPYMNRETTEADSTDYQTYYSKIAGSVAAPTAGLHFTPEVFENLKSKDIQTLECTLHVGAGTFKPVKADDITKHNMHAEQFELNLDLVNALLNHQGKRVAVGTTSLRILESLYQIGVNLKQGIDNPIQVLQDQKPDKELSYLESLSLVKEYLEANGDCTASTSIFIYPGKPIMSISGIITNFHQPSSSLIMLIAASIGEQWKSIYQHALENNYRFLSYGDSSLLWLK